MTKLGVEGYEVDFFQQLSMQRGEELFKLNKARTARAQRIEASLGLYKRLMRQTSEYVDLGFGYQSTRKAFAAYRVG